VSPNPDYLAVICTPTLDPEMGQRALDLAQKNAGIPCTTLMVVDENQQGGCKTANQALKQAFELQTSYIAYINDDVEIHQQDWLKRLIEVLFAHPKNGIAAPGCKCGTRPQNRGAPGLPKGVRTAKQLAFVTAVFKTVLFERIGFLDDGYYHWGCDSEFCERARKSGWRLLYVQDVFVKHNTIPHRQRAPHVQEWKRLDVARWKRRKR
jgi:GT2 family glycosyltransferase